MIRALDIAPRSAVCGIVGVPNVGKSCTFNALTKSQKAASENYPFCTIEPNSGKVIVPDARLERLAAQCGSTRVVPSQIEFLDVAGLVEGASQGEGLGNKFLSHVRQVSLLVHLVRCFQDTAVTHVSGSVDPLRDMRIIRTELMLADVEQLDRVQRRLGAKADKAGDRQLLDVAVRALRVLEGEGLPASHTMLKPAEVADFRSLNLLTSKPELFLCNVAEGDAALECEMVENVRRQVREDVGDAAPVMHLSARLEEDLAAMEAQDPDEAMQFMQSYGLEESGLVRFISAAYRALNLITFYTAGPTESRAWQIPRGATAKEAAGKIHTDLEKGFIRAEVHSYRDFVEKSAKKRIEGPQYVVEDGDVLIVKHKN